MSDERPLVQMKSIHKWFGGIHALHGVNFDVYHGEVVGLVGDNGAGKSTLMKILAGVYRPDSGEIYLDGSRVDLSSPKEAMKRGIEILHQDLKLVPSMTIARNIFLGREMQRRVGVMKLLDLNGMKERADEALRYIGLTLRDTESYIENLSGGERQGVAIARAMYFKPKLLILDEPTNNLSVKEAENVLGFIRDLRGQGITSIFITHNINHIYSTADRISIMSRGENSGVFRREETTIDEITRRIVSG